jgi:phosphatidylinositol glycan class N
VRLAGGIFMGICSLILFVERSPPLYHAYLGLSVFFWTDILSNMTLLRSIASAVQSAKVSQLLEVTATMAISFLVLEVLVSFSIMGQQHWSYLASDYFCNSYVYLKGISDQSRNSSMLHNYLQ